MCTTECNIWMTFEEKLSKCAPLSPFEGLLHLTPIYDNRLFSQPLCASVQKSYKQFLVIKVKHANPLFFIFLSSVDLPLSYFLTSKCVKTSEKQLSVCCVWRVVWVWHFIFTEYAPSITFCSHTWHITHQRYWHDRKNTCFGKISCYALILIWIHV